MADQAGMMAVSRAVEALADPAESSLVLGERCDMQPLTGFAHALICQRVALPSFSVLAHGGHVRSGR